MKSLGICVDNLGASQFAYNLIKNCNIFLAERFDVSILAFYETLTRPVVGPAFGIFNLSEVYGFEGTLITTSATLTYQTLKYPRPERRIYYANDLEWMRNLGYSSEFYQMVFRSGVEIVTRCEDYQKLIENCFNVKCRVVEQFKVEEFI